MKRRDWDETECPKILEETDCLKFRGGFLPSPFFHPTRHPHHPLLFAFRNTFLRMMLTALDLSLKVGAGVLIGVYIAQNYGKLVYSCVSFIPLVFVFVG